MLSSNMNNITVDSIIKRYNEGISDIANCKRAEIKGENDILEKSLKDAGEAISQSLEWGIKYHLKKHLRPPNYRSLEKNFKLPSVIAEYYWDEENQMENEYWNKTLNDEDSEVDFLFLKNNKNEITNNSKHGAGDIDFTILEKYSEHVKRYILDYVDNDAEIRTIDYFLKPEIDNCSNFYSLCDKFQYDERIYILITDRDDINPSYYKQFSKINWSLIIDFDKNSTEKGFCKTAYALQSKDFKPFKITDLVNKDNFSVYSESPVVMFANGFKEVPSYCSYKEWNRNRYSNKLDRFIEEFSQVYENQKTIVVCLMKDKQWVGFLHDTLEKYFVNMQFIIANDNNKKLLSLSEEKDAIHIGLSIQEIDQCFSIYLPQGRDVLLADEYKIPCLPTRDGLLSNEELVHLQENFDVLYNNIDSNIEENIEDFLIGNTILSWSGIKRKFAAERARFNKLYIKPIEDIIRNGRGRINILHEPGYGGSTVARQIAWYFHNDYPVLFLKKYRDKIVKEQLDVLHQKTKKPIILFMEIPQAISIEDANHLFTSTNQARPYIFICIKRGINESNGNNIKVTDWGNDIALLIDKYRPYIEVYDPQTKKLKENEYESIIMDSNTPYKKTPFYIGLLTFEEKFMAIKSYVETFVNSIKSKEEQRKVLIYLAICDKYIHQGLPNTFFHSVFSVSNKEVLKLENYFDSNDSIIESLLSSYLQGPTMFWKIKHPFFTDELLSLLLNKQNQPQDIGWMANLGTYCKEFIQDLAFNPHNENLQEVVLKELFIGSAFERSGEKFTKLITDIQPEERINIFKSLHDHFPESPHFCSHLARYYAIVDRNMELAIEYADKAISLSPFDDPLLHHIKGMCLRSIIYSQINNHHELLRNGKVLDESEIDNIIITLLEEAEDEFYIARKLRKESQSEDEYGYIPNIELLIAVIDYYSKIKGISKVDIIASAKEPFITWIEKAQGLLEDVRRIYQEDNVTSKYVECQHAFEKLYENYSTIIGKLTNQLDKTNYPTILRRQLVRLYMQKDDAFRTNDRINKRILTLMEENIVSEPKNERNFYLWFNAARYSSLKTDEIISKITEWKSISPSLEIIFYCYVFYVIKALEGSSEAAVIANKLIGECRNIGGSNKIWTKEWYSKNYQQILSNGLLKDLDKDEYLLPVKGYVHKYNHPGDAKIMIEGSLEVFFKPNIAGLTSECLNKDVEFFLGFSYDGLRADSESVKIIQ